MAWRFVEASSIRTNSRLESTIGVSPWRNGGLAATLAMIFLGITLSAGIAHATSGGGPGSSNNSKRGKVIDFEDEVVEGLNRRPLDSLSQISERDRKRKKPHLYRKRASFRSENAESIRLIKLTP